MSTVSSNLANFAFFTSEAASSTLYLRERSTISSTFVRFLDSFAIGLLLDRFRSPTVANYEVGRWCLRLLHGAAISLLLLDDVDPHAARRPLDGADRGLDVVRVHVAELLLRELADLSHRHLADLVLVRLFAPAAGLLV